MIESNHFHVEFGLLCYITEKAMAPHSSTLAWQIPWTEEPGGLQSMGIVVTRMEGRGWIEISSKRVNKF